MPGQKEPCFSIKGLSRTYGKGSAAVHALRGIDLTINTGEMVVLLGPSGSGKSTFLNILGGLDCATSGSVNFKGADVTAMSDRELTQYRRNHVGFIFQNYNLMPGLTAAENVRLITEIAAAPMPASEALELVGLGERQDHFPAQLSGGEQQRVAIARAIAKQPDVMLCDEPTGALDSKTSQKILMAIETVAKKLGTTVVMVTHHQGIAPIANRVIRFRDGQMEREDFQENPLSAKDIEL